MTTQHVPHTPLWRRFLSLPRTRLGWWAIGLAAPALVLLLPLQLGHNDWPAITMLASAGAGGLAGLIALARDPSLLVWVAQVPALFFVSNVFGGIYEDTLYIVSRLFGFGYEGGSPWVGPSAAVLLWAVLVFGIIWSYRDLPERKTGE